MAVTVDEQRALLAVGCSWCGARAGEFCRPTIRNRRREWSGAPQLLRDLPGFAHDARWRASGLVEAVG